MKKSYSGLDAVLIPLESDGRSILTASTKCKPIYTTHFDYDDNNVCDGHAYQDGSPEAPAATTEYDNCPVVGMEGVIVKP